MIDDLVAMYEKGAITADHLVAQCLHMVDPTDPGLVLGSLPPDILSRVVQYAGECQTGRMRANYGRQPAANQLEAAREWIEAKAFQ